MARFVYRFETIKRVKELLEKKVQRELGYIDYQIEQKKEEKSKFLTMRNDLQLDISEKKSRKAADIQRKFHLEKYYDERIELIDDEIKQLMKQREEKVEELLEVTKESKIFETLKEKHYEEFLREENKEEQKILDESATQKYAKDKN